MSIPRLAPRKVSRALVLVSLLASFAVVAGCASGGAYNFAREYEPLDPEKEHYDRAQQASYEDVKRDPNGYQRVEIGWMGVVTNLRELSDGRTRLELSLRAHQPRHLCLDASASSCRLTIAERDLGQFSVDLALAPDEKTGAERVWMGSLLKVYGPATGEYDEAGGPILDVEYYRHFPRGTYVTTGQRGAYRR